MEKKRKRGKVTEPNIPFTVRITPLHHAELNQAAKSLGWSAQRLVTFLTMFSRPMCTPYLNADAIKAASDEWDKAKRLQVARAKAAAIIAAASEEVTPKKRKIVKPVESEPVAS